MIPVARFLPMRRAQRRALVETLTAVFMLLFAIALLGLACFCASWATFEVIKALLP